MKNIKIGRDPKHHYFIDDGSVSRNHANIVVDNKTITLVDNNSTNGTFVLKQNEKIQIDRSTVNEDDQVFFGDVGPVKVEAILYMAKETTEISMKPQLEADETNPNPQRVRCEGCGGVVAAKLSICPDCGGLL